MTEIVLFHHVRGLTDGLHAVAADLEAAGHTVHLPDLFDGRTFASIEAGFEHLQTLDADERTTAVDAAMEGIEAPVVMGFSLGVMHAQRIAQTRPGVSGAIFFDACLPISGEWAIGPWPDGVPVQIHGKEGDEFFAHEGDVEAAREIVAAVGPERGELFTYAGSEHLFADPSLETYDVEAAALAMERVRAFLSRI